MTFKQLRAKVLDLHQGHCTLYPWHRAVELHEEPPRSLNPSWKEQPTTWYGVCRECHERLQDMNRAEAEEKLRLARQFYFPSMVREIEELWQNQNQPAEL